MQIFSANGCEHLVAVTADGELFTCGYNARGQLGHDSTSLVSTPRVVEALRGRILPGAETAVDLARRGFEAGKFSLLDVLDAQTALTTARTDLIAARLERAKALAALERAAAQ